MTHGDNNGLVLPPRVAPTQVVIVPIAMHKAGVLEKATELKERLQKVARVKLDATDNTPGWKFAEYEMKGVPLRLEIGPKDIENEQCVVVRRDTREKIVVKLADLETELPRLLDAVHDGLYQKALARRESMTYDAYNFEEIKDIADNKPGLIRALWCGDLECEMRLKDEVGITSRCMPFEQEEIGETCVCCGKKANKLVYWGKAY